MAVQVNNFIFELYCVESSFCGSYHVAGTMGVFYAREPYANVDAVHVTRFMGLAPVGNKDKQVLFLLYLYLLFQVFGCSKFLPLNFFFLISPSKTCLGLDEESTRFLQVQHGILF